MSKTTLEAIKLSDIIHVGSRFGRSVNLERDFYDQVSLEGYVLTTTAHDALRRIAEAYTDTTVARAWTLTGSYGSGKSAFALFAAKALNVGANGDAQNARDLIKEHDKDLWQSLFDRRRKTAIGNEGLCSVLVSGSREPISRALLRGMVTSIEHFWTRNPPLLLAEVRELLERVEKGEIIPTRRIVELFEELARKVTASHKSGGLLIVIDELGKLLEYTAANPREWNRFLIISPAHVSSRKSKNLFCTKQH